MRLLLVILIAAITAAPAAAARNSVAYYVSGIFDSANPNAAQLAHYEKLARRMSLSGATILLPCMIHIWSDSTLYYNNVPVVYGNGTINPGFDFLPGVFSIMKSQGAKLLWSVGGWGSDGDYKNLGPGARANLKVLFEWSGARGIDLDPEPVNTPFRDYFQNIVDTIKWARENGYMVTAAPYTNQRVWGDIMEATVDPTTGKPMLARMFAQLYGNFQILALLRRELEQRDVGLLPGEIDSFLWPGWAPCISSKQPGYPPTECGLVVGYAKPGLNRKAAASLAKAYGSSHGFYWEWGLLEGVPEKTSDTCNQTALQYTAATLDGLANPAPLKQASTMCAPLDMASGQRFSLLALNGTARASCAAEPGGPLVCSLGQVPTQLQAYPYLAWRQGSLPASPVPLNMSDPLALATGQRGEAGVSFLAYNETSQLLYLTTDAANTLPARMQLVCSTVPPDVTVFPPPPGSPDRGPLRLRYQGLQRQRYCRGNDVGVTCPKPSSTGKRDADDDFVPWNPRDPAAIEAQLGLMQQAWARSGQQVGFSLVELTLES